MNIKYIITYNIFLLIIQHANKIIFKTLNGLFHIYCNAINKGAINTNNNIQHESDVYSMFLYIFIIYVTFCIYLYKIRSIKHY